MPSANRMTTPVAVDEAQIEGRYARLGDYTVSFETFRQDADPASRHYLASPPGEYPRQQTCEQSWPNSGEERVRVRVDCLRPQAERRRRNTQRRTASHVRLLRR